MGTVPRSAFVFAALLAASIAAGCSSGSSSNAPTPAAPTPLPPLVFPSTSPAPHSTSFFPVPVPTATNNFQYKGLTATSAIGPTPNPSPPLTTTSITENDLFSGRAVFPGFSAGNVIIPPVANVYDDNITEAVVGVGVSFTSIIDNYYSLSLVPPPPSYPSGSQVVSLVGSFEKSPTSAPNTFVTGYAPSNGVIDVIPEPSDPSQNQNPFPIFANTAALQSIESDADGQITTRVVNPDGSYTENVSFANFSGSAQAVENSDGSGSYSYPDPDGSGQTNVSISAPSGGIIPVTYTLPGQSPQQVSVQNWYPTGKPNLYSQAFLNFGPSQIPSPVNAVSLFPPDCGLGSVGIGTPANLVSQSTNRVDTVFGEIEFITEQSYRGAGFPNVCEFDGDTVTHYYDYTQTVDPTKPIFSGTPLGTTNFQSVLSIIQETIIVPESRGRRGTQSVQRGVLVHGQVQGRPAPAFLKGAGFRGAAYAELERIRLKRHALIWRRLFQAARHHHRAH